MVLDKRSVVKHRTRAPASKSKRGGFSVGATNAPSGAYIGHGMFSAPCCSLQSKNTRLT